MALNSEPMSVAAGHALDEWIARLTVGIGELIDAGEAPAFIGLDQFLELAEHLRLEVKGGAEKAAAEGREMFQVSIPFTADQRRLLGEMGSKLLAYMEILTMRGKIVATPDELVLSAIHALTSGD